MTQELLKEWTKQAYGLLDSKYDEERIEKLDESILNLSKIRITDLVLYNIEDNEITVRYNKSGSKTFSKVTL